MDLNFSQLVAALNTAKLGGKTTIYQIAGSTIGVTATTYATGDVLGTGNPVAVEVMARDNGTGVIQSLSIGDLSKQDGAIDIIVFGMAPTATTFTNDSALDIADADLSKIIGVISIGASDYSDFADNSVATKTPVSMVVSNFSTTTGAKTKLWLAFVSRDSKTYAANEVSCNLGVFQD